MTSAIPAGFIQVMTDQQTRKLIRADKITRVDDGPAVLVWIEDDVYEVATSYEDILNAIKAAQEA